MRASSGMRHRRVGRGDPQQPDRALLRRSGRSAWRGWAAPSAGSSPGRRSTAGPAPATCCGFSQLRKPGRSPSAPHSRLFCAVGWPFICRMPQPGRPIMPRSRCRLLTWHGRRGGLVRLVEALQDGGQHPVARCRRSRAARRTSAASTPQIVGDPLRRVRFHDAAQLARSRGCAPSTQSSSTQPLANSSRSRPFISARLVPGRGGEVHVGRGGPPVSPRVDADQRGGFGAVEPVEHPRPQHRLRLGHVVPVAGRSRRSASMSV